MEKAIIGRKIGMSQIFDEAGKVIPVTVIEAGPCVVVQKKTEEKDGYNAVQLGFQDVAERKLSKPEQGHLKKAEVPMKKVLKEFKLNKSAEMNVGDEIKADTFAAGDKIDEVLDNVNQNGIVTLDRDALYKTPINQLTSNLMDVVIITSTLDSLSETMNFALPDMPLITGGGQDKEVWVYTAVNDNETHTIDKAIALGDYTYYTRSSKYERVTEEKITSIYSLSGVVTDENGYLKKDGKFIYARDVVQGDSGETYRYTKLERDSKLIDAADGETYTFLTDQLFFKNGPDGEYTKLTLDSGGKPHCVCRSLRLRLSPAVRRTG